VKVFEEGMGELGFPTIDIGANNMLSSLVPEKLKGTPSSDQTVTAEDIKQGEEVTYKKKGEETWQEYMLHNGWTLLLRPEVTKVIKTKKYNRDREPIYWANIQPIFTVRRSDYETIALADIPEPETLR
jgi:hypothetical protein